nr:13533_t:CDS:2 [Entrophospora candida]
MNDHDPSEEYEHERLVNEELMRVQEEIFSSENENGGGDAVDDDDGQQLDSMENIRYDHEALSEQGLDEEEGGEGVIDEGRMARVERVGKPNTKVVESESQKKLRKMIINIQNDDDLKHEEKLIKIQELMTNDWREKGKKSVADNSNGPSQDDFKPTYNEKKNSFGCNHYVRGAKLQAECCKGWFTCRFCHDDASDHKIDSATKNMMCMHCLTVQPASINCNNCKVQLARYYCDKCKLWDDEVDKDIFHCDKCGICRIGKEPDYFHCDVCDCCLTIHGKDSHQCIEKNMHRDCMICGEYLFTSLSSTCNMRCGHIIHKACFDKYILTAYQCPTCWKSVSNMEIYFRRIDALVAQQQMPPEYEHYVSKILCNDCVKQSTVKYHFIYHKCQYCKGYNTKVIETKELLPCDETNIVTALDNLGLDESRTGTADNSSGTSNAGGGSTSNGGGGSQVRQSRIMEVTAMMQGEDGPVDGGNATEHGTRNPFNSLDSNI